MRFGEKPNKPSPAVKFVDNPQDVAVSPIIFMEKDINTETHFVITRLTAGGKFVRGNLLYYNLEGVSCFCSLDSMIFVDTINKTMFVRNDNKIAEEVAPTNPEEREYIILYTDIGFEDAANDDEFPLRWESCIGRRMAYEHIKANAAVIDVDKSIVLVDNVKLSDSLTVREFMNYLKNSDIINEEDFDINDFSGSEYI